VLFTDSFVCVVSRDHPARGKQMTLAVYLSYSHIAVQTLDGQQTFVDRPLLERGVHRRIALTLPFFVPAAEVAASTDLVVTLPRTLATRLRDPGRVRILKAPPELADFQYSMCWHPRLTEEPAHRWIREQVREAATLGNRNFHR
jgi:DNA-binding transcriptional LysR family regulator